MFCVIQHRDKVDGWLGRVVTGMAVDNVRKERREIAVITEQHAKVVSSKKNSE